MGSKTGRINYFTECLSAMVEIIKYVLLWWLTIPHVVVYFFCKEKDTITMDVDRWCKLIRPFHMKWWRDVGVIQGGNNIIVRIVALSWLLINAKNYRNLFYLRVGYLKVLLFWLRKEPTLYIMTKSENFGAGTYIQHGFSTIITAAHIGKNCWINQQVTIGYAESHSRGCGQPYIGDNTRIGAGAKVCGNVRVGDNCFIGMNAVVVKDVPNNTTVIPSPTMVIRENDNRVYHKL